MRRNRSGFTIVELLIVIIVVGILAAITIVAFNGIRARAQTSGRAVVASNLVKSLRNYETLNGRYPGSSEARGASGAALLGLKVSDVEPPGYEFAGEGLRCSYPWSFSDGFCYTASTDPSGVGFTCEAPTACKGFTIQYRDGSDNLVTIKD